MKVHSENQRNIGLEYLRIISMFMIIMLHSIDHSGLYEALIPGSLVYYYEQFIYALVQVCVNCFVMISGYFLVKSKFRINKLFNLWIQVVFYSLFIKLLMMLFGETPFSILSLLSCFFPVISGRYWFITIYFGMYLLFPFYNIFINAMTKKQHKNLIIILIVLFSIWNSLYPGFAGMNSGGAWGLAWFTVLYFISSYIRLYYISDYKKLKWGVIFVLCPVIMSFLLCFSEMLNISILHNIASNWYKYDSIFVLIASISLFIFFLNYHFSQSSKFNKVIINISKTTLGVYLIHAHANICTTDMWQKLGIVNFMNSLWFPLYQLLIVVLIFIICSVIEFIRQALFKKVKIDYIVENFSKRLSIKFQGDNI